MRKSPKVIGLATALAALGGSAAVPPISEPKEPDDAQTATDIGQRIPAEAANQLPAEVELMSFTVRVADDGTMFPQHGSHSSHASHASHVSGGIPGGGGYYVPDLPAPIYAPPPSSVPTTSPTPSLAPAAGPDIAYAACVRAFGGKGVADISNELQQLFGVTQDVAVYAAKQALAAYVAGGHYCDGYHLG